MRLGFDAKRLFNNQSGLGNYSRTLVSSLQAQFPENDYLLYSPSLGKHSNASHFQDSPFETRTAGSIPKPLHSWWRSVQLGKQLSKDELDVYHGLSNELPENILSSGVKSVVTIHDLIFMRYPEYYHSIDRKIYQKKVQSACEKADAIVAISEQTKADLMEFFAVDEARIRVIYQGCDPSFGWTYSKESIESTLKSRGIQDPYVISIGSIEKRKDQLTIVKAFEKSGLSNSHKLLLVGKQTSYTREIRDHLRNSSCSDRVDLLDDVSFDELPVLLSGAQAMVYASEFEGFGIPILEGMAAGVPVIAANSSSLTEVGGDAITYFKTHNAEELGHQMNQLANDESLRIESIQKGLSRSKSFSNDQMAKQYHELYQELTQG